MTEKIDGGLLELMTEESESQIHGLCTCPTISVPCPRCEHLVFIHTHACIDFVRDMSFFALCVHLHLLRLTTSSNFWKEWS
jgi:hypothetical protein